MAESLIKDLPDFLCWHIASVLDKKTKPNWKTLLSLIPNNSYDSKAINKFHMEILSPFGSPSVRLLEDLGRKNKTVSQLLSWLESKQEWNELVSLLNRAKTATLSPIILRQSTSEGVCVGSELSLNVEASGEPPLHYQWFKEGFQLDNKITFSLRIAPIAIEDLGNYTCRVSNQFGFVFSKWIKVYDTLSISNLPTVTVYPKIETFQNGDTLRLYGNAVGNPPPMLQWFFNKNSLLGECGRDLLIDRATIEHEGIYELEASNKYGTVMSLPSHAIYIKSPSNISNISNCSSLLEDKGKIPLEESKNLSIKPSDSPTQKIALLIGNGEYYQEEKLGKLFHPINDTQELAGALMTIGFKVVSLINLDLLAMKSATDFFYDLLDAGTYAVFYFAGYSFEVNNEVYLMPVDATDNFCSEENLPLSRILATVAAKHAKLSVLLLDCCIPKPEYNQFPICNPFPKLLHQAANSKSNEQTIIHSKNVIIGFGYFLQHRLMQPPAMNSNQPAMNNGFFVKFLTEYIVKPLKIDDVLFEVARCVDTADILDPSTGRSQVIYRYSTVIEEMKLTDKVLLLNSETPQTCLWQQAHIAPKSPETILKNSSVIIKLIFTAEFSNVLLIHSIVEKNHENDKCNFKFYLPHRIGGAPVEIARPNNKISDASSEFVRISNLERIEGDINIHLDVTYETLGVWKQQLISYSIKEKPLYAKVAEIRARTTNR